MASVKCILSVIGVVLNSICQPVIFRLDFLAKTMVLLLRYTRCSCHSPDLFKSLFFSLVKLLNELCVCEILNTFIKALVTKGK